MFSENIKKCLQKKKKKFYKTHLCKKFISALTYKNRASPTNKYIFEKKGTVKFDLFPNIHNNFLPSAEQEPQRRGDNISSTALDMGVVVGRSRTGKIIHQFSLYRNKKVSPGK